MGIGLGQLTFYWPVASLLFLHQLCCSGSVKSKVALYHLTEAHGRLEDSKLFYFFYFFKFIIMSLYYYFSADSVALGGVACNAYTDLCTRYNITDYPTVLIFTPNTLGSPAYFPQSAGVIDSVRLQKLLNKKQVKKENTLVKSQTLVPINKLGFLGPCAHVTFFVGVL